MRNVKFRRRRYRLRPTAGRVWTGIGVVLAVGGGYGLLVLCLAAGPHA
ncbi:hypothetical protein [Sulfobacillus sp. hq2]|nr:hypothetical protein [Sulfobacillus sp. hq2]